MIDRIVEHGEVLAHLRLVQSYFVPPTTQAPAVREVGFDCRQGNLFADHSMTRLACDLTLARNFPLRDVAQPASQP